MQKPLQTSNVQKRTFIYNALLKPKPDDFNNALYNYGCFYDNPNIVQHIKCFSICEKHFVIKKLYKNEKLESNNNWLIENCWGETKTDGDESSGFDANANFRNSILDPLYFEENELHNLEKELEHFKLYLEKLNDKHKNQWFRQRAPIFKNILRIFNEFSHLELIVLYEHLKEKEIESLNSTIV